MLVVPCCSVSIVIDCIAMCHLLDRTARKSATLRITWRYSIHSTPTCLLICSGQDPTCDDCDARSRFSSGLRLRRRRQHHEHHWRRQHHEHHRWRQHEHHEASLSRSFTCVQTACPRRTSLTLGLHDEPQARPAAASLALQVPVLSLQVLGCQNVGKHVQLHIHFCASCDPCLI